MDCAKRKRDYESGADVIGAALSRMEEAAAPSAPRGASFVPSAGFAGARSGYFFGRGAQGVGYYADSRGSGGAAASASAAFAAMPPPQSRSDAQAMPPPPSRAPQAPSGAQLLEAAERDASGIEVEELDVRAVRRAVLGLERRLNENLSARVKYADEPEKFIDSEVDLHEEVKRMGSLAAAPELYPELVRLGAVPSLLALLAHDNADVAAEGALLLRELTDADAAAESDAALAGAAALAEALSAGADAEEPEACAGLAALVAALGRFDETQAEEASAVHSLLNVFENLVEISPVLRDRLLAPAAGLLAWLLRRVTAPGGCVDANRVYAAELLAVLLAGGDAAARRLGEAGGVDALLRAIAPFKGGKKAKERPKDEAETEMEGEFVENCFDALCSAMLLDDNKAQFVAAEGVELMLLVIRGKGPAKGAALRCLDFAVTRCAPAASRLVAAGGLGAVFAAFSGRSAAAARSRRGADAPDAEEARAVSLLASALQLLPRGAPRDRVAAKFVEEEFSKVDRLVELWFKYAQRVATAEQSWDADAANDDEDGADEDEDGDDERYAARMDAGLYTLQQLALILAQLWCVGHPGLCGRAAQALQLGGGAMAAVRSVLREHATALGDAEGEEARDALRLKVLRLADTLYLPGEAHSRSASDAEDDDDVAGEEAGRPGGAAEAAEGMLDEDE